MNLNLARAEKLKAYASAMKQAEDVLDDAVSKIETIFKNAVPAAAAIAAAAEREAHERA